MDYSITNYTGQFAQGKAGGENEAAEVVSSPMIEVNKKPAVDLKAKMLLSKQQKEPLVIHTNLGVNAKDNKRMKAAQVVDPDDTLDSP